MVTILFAVVSIFVFRFRSRAVLELKLVALEHQLAVLRRQRPGRPQLSSLDRLLWVLLYRIRPQVIDAMVVVKPATVVEWHRQGFRFYCRCRYRKSNCRLASSSNDRGFSVGHCISLSPAGPEQIVWSGSPPSRSSHGDHGSHHCAAVSLAEPLR